MTPDEQMSHERKTVIEAQEALARFLARVKYGSFVVKKCDTALLFEETRQEKKNLAHGA
jgi:hypothetical protein